MRRRLSSDPEVAVTHCFRCLEPWGPEDVLETFYVVERPQYVQIMRAELCPLCRADYRAKGMIPYEQ